MPEPAGLRVRVQRAATQYPVLFCRSASHGELRATFDRLGLLERRGELGRVPRRAFVVLDRGFAATRSPLLESITKIYPRDRNPYLEIPGDESSKSWQTAERILGEMLAASLTRADLCLAVGGGVVGDVAGFAASLYHRGIDVVHVPTTLLAMVDSSIGGKTAVNHPRGKNLVGTFHQPAAVVEVLDVLKTLPREDFQSGLGEVFKYAVGFSAPLFRYLAANADRILARHPAALEKVMKDCVRIKARIVGGDEREAGVAALRSGERADRRLLNLGHTLGHAVEKRYVLPHGVAVAIGVTLSAKFSSRLKLCPARCYDETMALARKLSLKTEPDPGWNLGELLPYVRADKKLTGETLQFVALRGIGRAFIRPTRIEELAGL